MFQKIKKVLDGVKKLDPNELMYEVFRDDELAQVTEDYITEEQLYERGIDGNGHELPPYTEYTKAQKKSKGQKSTNTTLKDTGRTHNSLRVVANKSSIRTIVEDRHDLTKRYGEAIWKLSKEGIKTIKPLTIDKSRLYLRKKLLGR